MTRPAVKDMLQKIDNRAPALSMLERYYAGRQELAYLTPEAREAIGTKFDRLAVNVPRLLVSAISERLTVSGFDVAGQRSDKLWSLWTGSDLDQLAAQAHREALVLGSAYALVWADRH
uniref:phage portal protein n=1 Tax=Dietzia cinnamea TaxID=321318 RepID=UPI000AFF6B85